MSPDSRKWYAVRTRPRHEKTSAAVLERRGFERFLPLYAERHRWADRIKQLTLPLFPGYVFCRFDLDCKTPVLSTPGVIGIVGFGGVPAAVDDREIEDLRRVVTSTVGCQPWPRLEVGDRVRLADGPLAGLSGVLIGTKANQRLIVSVTLLNRSVSVEIDSDWVSRVDRADGLPCYLAGVMSANS